jgi:hypothetical protein
MPKKRLNVIVSAGRVVASRAMYRDQAKQSSHELLIFLSLFSMLLFACAPQANSLPLVIQETPIVNSSIQISTFTPAPASQNTTQGQQVYALVAPFPTVTDGVTFDELKLAWAQGTAPAAFSGHPLLIDESTLAAFSALWGEPANGLVRSVASDRLLHTAWSELGSWAIVPFEVLEPKWKVLTVDGQSPIRKNFEISKYPLVLNFDIQSNGQSQLSSNYDPTKLTTIIMTGVTALVRATAYTMELKSVTYPGEKIRDLMREADIAHISNEIPFFTGCTFPKPNAGALVFCSDPKNNYLLTEVGADVI